MSRIPTTYFTIPPVAEGQPWPVPVSHVTGHGMYGSDGAHHTLIIVHKPMSRRQLDRAADGRWHFGIYEHPDAIFFLYENEIWEWNDAPFCWCLVPPELATDRGAVGPQDGIGLAVALVDGASGKLSRWRMAMLSPSFARALHAAIDRQKMRNITVTQHDAAIRETYRRFPTADGLIRRAAARCTVTAKGKGDSR